MSDSDEQQGEPERARSPWGAEPTAREVAPEVPRSWPVDAPAAEAPPAETPASPAVSTWESPPAASSPDDPWRLPAGTEHPFDSGTPTSGTDAGWGPPPVDPPSGGGGGFGTVPPPSPPPGQSHNPVDKLTRGLPHGLRVTIDWIVTIVGAIAIVLVVKAFVVNPYRIPSSSMEPTLHCAQPAIGCEARFSDRVLANRFIYHLRSPRRGEIIVFKTPPAARLKCGAGGTFVKRLIGLPGDTVEVRLKNGLGYVYINGKPLGEPYIQRVRRSSTQAYGPTKVAAGNYFMMGDNRAQSCDSRMWGTVPRANLIGKVFATYWPPNRVSLH